MFFVEAHINGDYDIMVIGLFSTVKKAVFAAREWVKQERAEESEDDICLSAWRCTPDSSNVERVDCAHDHQAKELTKAFREIEKEFEVEKSHD